jgi:hypothetical protein
MGGVIKKYYFRIHDQLLKLAYVFITHLVYLRLLCKLYNNKC